MTHPNHSLRRTVSSISRTLAFVFLSTVALCSTVGAQTTPINWTPTSFEWTCVLQANNERLCSLTARGPEPAASQIGNTASGWFRVYRAASTEPGTAILTIPFSMPCTRTASGLECFGQNLLKLASGISPLTSGLRANTDFKVSASVQTQVADWNRVGGPSAQFEGIVALRMLNGFRGQALVDGLTLSAGVTADGIEQLAYIAKFNDWFTYPASGTEPAATFGGLIYLRCLLGLRGQQLTAGIAVPSAAIDDKCVQLTALD